MFIFIIFFKIVIPYLNLNESKKYYNKCDDMNTRIQHYRTFISTYQVEELKNKYYWKKRCFLDEYFDDKEYTLTKNNMWLRRRDILNWCLKKASLTKEKNIHIIEIRDKKSIINELSAIGCNLVNSVDEIDKSVLSKHMRIRCDEILKYCPVRIASIPTSRWILDRNSEDYCFYVESCYIKENTFYNIATLSMKGDIKLEALNELEILKDTLYHPARSKVIQSLFLNNKNLYNLLKSYEYIIPSPLNNENLIINECIFPSPKVSSDEMGKVAITAVRNHLDFGNAAFIYHNKDRNNDSNDEGCDDSYDSNDNDSYDSSNDEDCDEKNQIALTDNGKQTLINIINDAYKYISSLDIND